MTTSAVRIALMISLAVSLAFVPTALAAKGGGGGNPSGGSSLSLVLLNSSDGLPHFGQQVTFNISTTAERPQVNVRCYKNGTLVYEEWHGFFEGAWFGQTFTLGPTPSWSGGAADCSARLVNYSNNGRLNTYATISFTVYA